MRYAIDNEDIRLLERLDSIGLRYTAKLSNGIDGQDYAEQQRKSKVIKWIKQKQAAAERMFDNPYSFINRFNRTTDELEKAKAQRDKEILDAHRKAAQKTEGLLEEALLGEKASKCCGTKCTIM